MSENKAYVNVTADEPEEEVEGHVTQADVEADATPDDDEVEGHVQPANDPRTQY